MIIQNKVTFHVMFKTTVRSLSIAIFVFTLSLKQHEHVYYLLKVNKLTHADALAAAASYFKPYVKNAPPSSLNCKELVHSLLF